MKPAFAVLNGAACRYAVDRRGPRTLVLVHELGGCLESWDDLVPLLAPDLDILRHDLRGAGLSQKVRGRLDLDVLADDVAALLDHVGEAHAVDVMGAAAGAAVAVRFATRHTARCRRLVLLAPALGVPPERREAAMATADLLDRDGMKAIAGAVLPKAFPEALWTDETAKARAIARWYGADPEGYAAMYRAIAETGVLDEIGAIAQPTLLIAGAQDPFNPAERLRAIAATIPGCRFEIAEAGHFPAVQSPQAVAPLLTAFLDAPEAGS